MAAGARVWDLTGASAGEYSGTLPFTYKGGETKLIANPFKVRVDALLMEVKMSLQSERWDEARIKMEQADTLLRKWVWGRLRWIHQIVYLGQLEQRLRTKARTSRYIVSVRGAIADLIVSAPTLDSPQLLRAAAERWRGSRSARPRVPRDACAGSSSPVRPWR